MLKNLNEQKCRNIIFLLNLCFILIKLLCIHFSGETMAASGQTNVVLLAGELHSPTYQLSKYLSQVLSPFVAKSDSHVCNSHEFAEFIQSVMFQSDDILGSFDVVSLFTSVPVDLAVREAKLRLQQDNTLADHTSLEVEEVVELLEFCLSAKYFAFPGSVYQQTFGTAMGSPVSITVANLVMEDIEERAL